MHIAIQSYARSTYLLKYTCNPLNDIFYQFKPSKRGHTPLHSIQLRFHLCEKVPRRLAHAVIIGNKIAANIKNVVKNARHVRFICYIVARYQSNAMTVISFILKSVLYLGLFLFVVGVVVSLWESVKMCGKKDRGALPWWVFWRP
ncbi:MAG: hypothetical protein NC230_06255 [Bacteroides sp.]|nr:hypothetical protein [Bacteroides sp.]